MTAFQPKNTLIHAQETMSVKNWQKAQNASETIMVYLVANVFNWNISIMIVLNVKIWLMTQSVALKLVN